MLSITSAYLCSPQLDTTCLNVSSWEIRHEVTRETTQSYRTYVDMLGSWTLFTPILCFPHSVPFLLILLLNLLFQGSWIVTLIIC